MEIIIMIIIIINSLYMWVLGTFLGEKQETPKINKLLGFSYGFWKGK
jgi:hypothetical protein